MITEEVTAFLIFVLACSAFLIGLMMHYARRLGRLRASVSMLGRVDDMVPQRAQAPHKRG
ncbi:hypothetical protein SR870_08830 [Rhodopseudomonas palustris]|uniref:hypothetical protein n=1 Tax=Rhodopseudomonas palustris TaxID=1076 RepID=UPI002ACDB783|nr:hypothetical protein [Rhodopseudomonas palustris]WQH01356.1 hypothetical protein SR870_08830 [Rhodopseudomonas palustris]